MELTTTKPDWQYRGECRFYYPIKCATDICTEWADIGSFCERCEELREESRQGDWA